ncbi:MAG: hypothetical protein WHV66_14960, partial [Anaerolineales bacterium]
MSTLLQFSSDHWHKLQNDWALWWQGKLDRPLIVIEAFDAHSGLTYEHLYPNLVQFGLNTSAKKILDQIEPVIQSVHWLGDAYPRWWLNFGPGILAAFLGSQVNCVNGVTWFAPSLHNKELRTITLSLDPNAPWYRHTLTVFEAAVQRWGNSIVIGYPDLGGILDILASLRGTDKLLLDVVDTPEEVSRLCSEITRTWLEVFKQLNQIHNSSATLGFSSWAPLWMPNSGYMLQCDFSYMISPRMFQKFVLPDLLTCCNAMNFPFYHL